MENAVDNKNGISTLKEAISLLTNLPIGLVLVDDDVNLLDANDYMYKHMNAKRILTQDMKFGNVFNCSNVADPHAICGETGNCKECNLRQGVLNVINNDEDLIDVELMHEFTMNGRKTKKWFKIDANRVADASKKSVLVSFTDITSLKTIQDELFYLGITDELTRIYNR